MYRVPHSDVRLVFLHTLIVLSLREWNCKSSRENVTRTYVKLNLIMSSTKNAQTSKYMLVFWQIFYRNVPRDSLLSAIWFLPVAFFYTIVWKMVVLCYAPRHQSVHPSVNFFASGYLLLQFFIQWCWTLENNKSEGEEGGRGAEDSAFRFGVTVSLVLLKLLPFEDWKYGLGFRTTLPTE